VGALAGAMADKGMEFASMPRSGGISGVSGRRQYSSAPQTMQDTSELVQKLKA